jgi:hypothetical protein
VRLEGLGQLKTPMISTEIDPASFRLVVQCLNLLRYRVPRAQQLVATSNNKQIVTTITIATINIME